MRLYFRESPINYGTYTFPYQVLAEREPPDALASIYAKGFLPASNEPTEPRELFYLARSLRLDLSTLTFDKKRRYLQRRGAEAGLRSEILTLEALASLHPQWKDCALRWVSGRFQPPYMTSTRLGYILTRGFLTHCIATYAGTELVGVTILPLSPPIAHYWFVFYDPEWQPERSLGKWILGDCARVLTAENFEYLYLGTCYRQAASYKFQGIASGVEHFDGNGWSDSIECLQKKLKSDEPTEN